MYIEIYINMKCTCTYVHIECKITEYSNTIYALYCHLLLSTFLINAHSLPVELTAERVLACPALVP